MKILIASTPATGHLNPMLAIGRILIAGGHDVVCLSGSALCDRIEGSGAKFRPLPPGADLDFRDLLVAVPQLKGIPPGLEWLRIALEHAFVDTVRPHGAPFIMIAFEPDLRQIAKPAVRRDVGCRKVAMIIDDGTARCIPLVQDPSPFATQ